MIQFPSKIRLIAVCFCLMSLFVSGCSRERDTRNASIVTFESMLPRLTNRTAVALAPPAGARMRMVSSYDRTGGNSDWLQNLRPDSNGLVTIAEINGPGCVVRIWLTGSAYQDMRFFIDGELVPRIFVPTSIFFGGGIPFSYPLNGVVSGGAYSYLPIPFEKSLVIKGKWPDITPDARPYLHINYFEYPRGTKVESFPHELTAVQLDAVAEVNREWLAASTTIHDSNAAAGPGHTGGQDIFPKGRDLNETETYLSALLEDAESAVIGPGEEHVWLIEDGEAMIDGFAITIDFDDQAEAKTRKHALRELALHFYWDGLSNPSVAVPIGDFFGNAFNWRAWRSMFASQIGGVFISQWPMPYRRGARATLRNDGEVPLRVRTVYRVAERPAGTRYFHAAWHHVTGQGVPFPILYTEGSGHFAGCYLVSFASDGDWNILEGDESFQIDDEPWPSIHGTGLEDYFNGAWYYSGLCDMPIHGLLEKAAMRTTQYRWHPNDLVPFDKRLSMQIEFGHANAAQGYMSSVAFWYQDEPQARRELAVGLRRKPADQLDNAVLMPELFELERISHWREAADRCELFAARVGDKNIKDLMQVRQAAYATLSGEPKAVTRMLDQTTIEHPEVRRQADMLAAIESNSDAGILGVQARGQFKVFLNGQLIGEGNSPNNMLAWPVHIPDGRHVVAVQVMPDSAMPFVSVSLRYGNYFLRTDDDWLVSYEAPDNWPEFPDDTSGWFSPTDRLAILPRMETWQLDLNAFVNMQSARQLYQPCADWGRRKNRKAYFVREFVKGTDK